MFALSTLITIGLYAYMAFLAKKASSAANVMKRGDRDPTYVLILKRGGLLVGAFFACWSMWSFAGLSTFIGSTPALWVDTVAAMLVALQPIVDGATSCSPPTASARGVPSIVLHKRVGATRW